ncbi:VUT family protein [Endozoicomonas sp. SCSIO W0465]|uniref:VUT family protein n=1 Tax=Endozoicomonas TaxID=305899 RepID=UPI0020763A50|nr:VUT family protein [Endozoicomonas sp. SCSIO W0465]USE38098.1 VUT family protein [Endozoicomonas sp. SCSIO W0465]
MNNNNRAVNTMRLIDYDPEKDEVLVVKAGLTTHRKIRTFIETGQVDELNRQDRARLHKMLQGHPFVFTDHCTFGGHSFSVSSQHTLLRVLRLAYMAVVILCPLAFLGQTELLGVILTGGSLFFSLSFTFLDCISELYGYRRARGLVIDVSAVLMVVGLLGQWWAEWMGLDPLIRELTGNFMALGCALFVTDMINIGIFHKLRKKMQNRGFVIRSALSSVIAMLVFAPVGGFIRFGEFWHNDAVSELIKDTTLSKIILSFCFLVIGTVIVYGTRQWRREYVK